MQLLSQENYIAIIEYVIRYMLMFTCCATGSILKDRFYTSKRKTKKFYYVYSAVYAIPATAVLILLYENIAYSLSIGTWGSICFFTGLWSREIVALLLNNKIVLVGIKYAAKSAAKKVIDITDDECEKISEDLHDAIDAGSHEDDKPHKARSPDDDTKDGKNNN